MTPATQPPPAPVGPDACACAGVPTHPVPRPCQERAAIDALHRRAAANAEAARALLACPMGRRSAVLETWEREDAARRAVRDANACSDCGLPSLVGERRCLRCELQHIDDPARGMTPAPAPPPSAHDAGVIRRADATTPRSNDLSNEGTSR